MFECVHTFLGADWCQALARPEAFFAGVQAVGSIAAIWGAARIARTQIAVDRARREAEEASEMVRARAEVMAFGSQVIHCLELHVGRFRDHSAWHLAGTRGVMEELLHWQRRIDMGRLSPAAIEALLVLVSICAEALSESKRVADANLNHEHWASVFENFTARASTALDSARSALHAE